jgi:filamentous hemagglutinin
MMRAAGAITIKAVEGLRIDLRQVDQQTVSQAIDAMVAADPQLAWIKAAQQRGDVDWRLVRKSTNPSSTTPRAWGRPHS